MADLDQLSYYRNLQRANRKERVVACCCTLLDLLLSPDQPDSFRWTAATADAARPSLVSHSLFIPTPP
jgi:hypothetical protein